MEIKEILQVLQISLEKLKNENKSKPIEATDAILEARKF